MSDVTDVNEEPVPASDRRSLFPGRVSDVKDAPEGGSRNGLSSRSGHHIVDVNYSPTDEGPEPFRSDAEFKLATRLFQATMDHRTLERDLVVARIIGHGILNSGSANRVIDFMVRTIETNLFWHAGSPADVLPAGQIVLPQQAIAVAHLLATDREWGVPFLPATEMLLLIAARADRSELHATFPAFGSMKSWTVLARISCLAVEVFNAVSPDPPTDLSDKARGTPSRSARCKKLLAISRDPSWVYRSVWPARSENGLDGRLTGLVVGSGGYTSEPSRLTGAPTWLYESG